MSKVIVTSFVILGVVFLAQPVFAQEAAKEAVEAVQPVEVGNKICPVGGEEVGQMGPAVKHVYNGKIYNLCCAMCAGDFDKDPEKYSKIAEDEVAASAVPSGS